MTLWLTKNRLRGVTLNTEHRRKVNSSVPFNTRSQDAPTAESALGALRQSKPGRQKIDALVPTRGNSRRILAETPGDVQYRGVHNLPRSEPRKIWSEKLCDHSPRFLDPGSKSLHMGTEVISRLNLISNSFRAANTPTRGGGMMPEWFCPFSD